MAVLLRNNAVSRLASSLTAAATTLSVTSGEGARFPAPTGGDWFPLTIIKSSGALEIVRCTARSGDVLTVTRAQEVTAAQAFSAGDRVELRITAAALAEFMQGANNLSEITDPAAARDNLDLTSAATSQIQSSQVDITAGALLTVGAFGLGSGFSVPSVTASDLNLLENTGFYGVVPGTTQNIPAVASGSMCIHMRFSSGSAEQLLTSRADDRMFYRRQSGGTWSAWVEFYHTGNLSPVETTRTITAGNGLTGGGSLAADRTLTLGTPSSISTSTSNSATSTSHTHNLILTTSDVTNLNAGATAGGVGSYAILQNNSGSGLNPGDTVAGANTNYASASASASTSPSGTWRSMSACPNTNRGLFLRIT